MAESADALDSGSSRGNSVEVQVLLSAPKKAFQTLMFRRLESFFVLCEKRVLFALCCPRALAAGMGHRM